MAESLEEVGSKSNSEPISKADGSPEGDAANDDFLEALKHLASLHGQQIKTLRQQNCELHKKVLELRSALDEIQSSVICAQIDEPHMIQLTHEVAAELAIFHADTADKDTQLVDLDEMAAEFAILHTDTADIIRTEAEPVLELLKNKEVVDLDEVSTGSEAQSGTPIETPPLVDRWLRIVDGILLAANTKRLYELRDHWIKPERFMQRVAKKNENLDLEVMSIHKIDTRPHGNSGLDHIKIRMHRSVTKTLWPPILEPHSTKRVVWMSFGMFLMVYDLIMLPMQIFDEFDDDNAFLRFMQWFGQIFWTVDIAVTFFTGVYINSELCVKLSTIARTYASTWLVLDLLVVVPLWVVEIFGTDGAAAKSASLLKNLRMLRFLRLMRLAKFEHYLQEALAAVNSSALLLCVGIVKLMTMLIIVNHLNACCWYGVGVAGNGGWVEAYEGTTLTYRYLTSMHWAITQFQGTSDIVPGVGGGKELVERAYAVVTVILALIILSAFVSTLTNMMMQLQSLREANTRMQRQIRGFLSDNNISPALSVRVKKYVDWKQSTVKSPQFGSEMEVLQLLPRGLQMDIMKEVRGPWLIGHGLFFGFMERHARTFSRLCFEAIEANWPAPDEMIFMPQDTCTQMYFVASGKCKYMPMPPSPPRSSFLMTERLLDVTTKDVVELGVGSWLSEGVLWTSWEHVGVLMSTQDPVLLTLHEKEFQRVVTSHPPAHVSAVIYARQFIAGLNRFGVVYSDVIDMRQLAARSSIII